MFLTSKMSATMENNTAKRAIRRKRALQIVGYAVVAIILMLGTKCEDSVTITTPEKDVQYISQLAETIRTEDDLRKVEQLATRYEIAYKHSLGGAAAMRFKTLVEPVLIEAGERREQYSMEEEYLAELQATFHGRLDDMDRAWSMQLRTPEEDWAIIEANLAEIERININTAELIAEKEQLGYAIVEAGYLADMLAELGVIEDQILANGEAIAAIEHRNEIIRMAYRLQRNEVLMPPVAEQYDVVDTEFEKAK